MAMMDVAETIAWVLRHTLRTCLRGMALAVTAVAWLPLFVASLVCVVLLPTGLGVVLAPKSLLAVRRQAERQRRWAREWSGVTIAAPYRSRPTKPTNRLVRVFRRCGWVLGDPATWRDLLCTLVNVPVSVVLGLLPAFMLVAFWWTVVDDYGTVVDGWRGVAPHGFLLQLFLLGMLPACAIAGPWLLKIRAIASSSLLAPTRKEMAARVGELAESRWDAVDASAAELRRIERDLHDGAQARLVALGMNIGFAEQMAEEPAQVDSGHRVEVAQRVVGERLGHEDARVVDQGVDPAELRDAGRDHALGGGGVGDVALDGQDSRVAGGGDGPRGGDDGVAQLAVGVDHAGAEAL
jgi:signal transduction histidine kinase